MDVKGSWQRWLKVRDLTRGVTYFFRVQARTVAYGPELQANVTAGPAEGKWPRGQAAPRPRPLGPVAPRHRLGASPLRDAGLVGPQPARTRDRWAARVSQRPVSAGTPQGRSALQSEPVGIRGGEFGFVSWRKKN